MGRPFFFGMVLVFLFMQLVVISQGGQESEPGTVEFDRQQYQQWSGFIKERKFLEAHQVAREHLREYYATKTLRLAIWWTCQGLFTNDAGDDFGRWDYVSQIIALEKDPKKRKKIIWRQFDIMRARDAAYLLYDGLTFLQRFDPDSAYTRAAVKQAYTRFLEEDKKPFLAARTAREFKLGQEAVKKAIAIYIGDVIQEGYPCDIVQVANGFNYTSPEIEGMRKDCIRRHPRDRRIYEKPKRRR